MRLVIPNANALQRKGMVVPDSRIRNERRKLGSQLGSDAIERREGQKGTRFYVSPRAFILLSAFMAMTLACVLAYFLAAAAG